MTTNILQLLPNPKSASKLFTWWGERTREPHADQLPAANGSSGASPHRRMLLAMALALPLILSPAAAQDNVLSYQGRVQSSGTNFTGTGQFKFALVTVTNEAETATATATVSGGFVTILTPVEVGNGYGSAPIVAITGGGGSGATATANVSGGSVVSYTVTSPGSGYTSLPTVTVAPPPADPDYTTYWSNDGSSVGGSQPAAAVGVPVNKGLFTVRLGDTNLPNMRPFPTGLFRQPNLQLLTWFNDGVHGFGVIEPAHRLTAVAYALTANFASVAEQAGSLTGSVGVDQLSGLIGTDQLAPNAITTAKIADGAVAPNNLSTLLRSNTFWRLSGNADTAGNVDFIGTIDNKPFDLRVNNVRALRLEDNGDGNEDDDTITDEAPNVIGGSKRNKVGAAVVGAIIAGGGATNGIYTFTSPLPPYGEYSIALSRSNAIYADFGSILGGFANLILEDSVASMIGGGSANEINSASRSTISGGSGNTISITSYATVAGGRDNSIAGGSGAIGGGELNKIEANHGTIAGGWANTLRGDYGAIGGGSNNRTAADIRFATIPGGNSNATEGEASTVGGGEDNTSSGTAAVVAGGADNEAGGGYSTVGGGRNNEATGHYAFVGGGSNNVAIGGYGAIGGGLGNIASGAYSVVVGGRDNLAEGNFSFAGGRRAWAYNNGSFAWGDSTTDTTVVAGENQFRVRASGGVSFYSKADLSSGVSLASDGTAWSTISDRNAKKDFAPLDCLGVLDQLMTVPIQRWHYNWEEEAATPHIGPTAQDFKAAFYPGRDDKGITTLELDGVALAAIQGLNEKVETGKQKAETRMEQLEAENARLKQRLEKLERLVNAGNGGAR